MRHRLASRFTWALVAAWQEAIAFESTAGQREQRLHASHGLALKNPKHFAGTEGFARLPFLKTEMDIFVTFGYGRFKSKSDFSLILPSPLQLKTER